MFKVFMLGLATGLTLFLTVNIRASRNSQKNVEQAKYQAELVDATPVQAGILTDKQRIHSKQFAMYREMRGGRGIVSLASRAKSEGHKIAQTEISVGNGRVPRPQSPKIFFGELARASDAIILGRMIGKTSQVTEDDGFLFTDYNMVVAEVLKDNAAASIAPKDTITVTWPGGKVLIDGVIMIARDRNLLPLPTNGHDVVLFLRFLPETGSYYAAKYCVAYELDGPSVRALTEAPIPPGVIQDRDSFLEAIRTAAANK